MLGPMQVLMIFAALLLPKTSFAWSPFGPSDYDECVLESMEGVKSDLAAKLIMNSCLEKFPPKSKPEVSCKEHKLQPAEVSKIQGSASIGDYGPMFMGKLYNPFTNKVIKSVTVRVRGDNIVKQGQIYKIKPAYGKISPQSSGEVNTRIQIKPTNFTWSLVSVSACDV